MLVDGSRIAWGISGRGKSILGGRAPSDISTSAEECAPDVRQEYTPVWLEMHSDCVAATVIDTKSSKNQYEKDGRFESDS